MYTCENFIYGDHSEIGNSSDWAILTLNNVERVAFSETFEQTIFKVSNGPIFIFGYSISS